MGFWAGFGFGAWAVGLPLLMMGIIIGYIMNQDQGPGDGDGTAGGGRP